MRVVVLSKDGYDYSSAVDAFVTELEAQSPGSEIERLNPDEYEGESLARTLDILEFPAVVALDNKGTMIQKWTGTPLPPISEVAYYINL